jgi:hypothetical protein
MTRLRPTSSVPEAAYWYASTAHWPVTAGAHVIGSGGCSCGQPACPLPGGHPVGRWGWLAATTDAERVRETWERCPAASIIAPTGRRFDILDVPLAPGREAMLRFELMGRSLGPVVEHSDRLLFWVASGARLLHHLVHGDHWPHHELGLHCRSEGEFVPLPPTGQARWVIPPTGSDGLFPQTDDLLGIIVQACRQRVRPQPVLPTALRSRGGRQDVR